jgi:hypothetical protein
MTVLRNGAAVAGLLVAWGMLISAAETFLLLQRIRVWLTRGVFRSTGIFFRFRAKRALNYLQRDQIMALYATASLITMPLVLSRLVLAGNVFLFSAFKARPVQELLRLSGSSLLALGFASDDSFPSKIPEFTEAMPGLFKVALLIAYLPGTYTVLAKPETNVGLLAGWAGQEPGRIGTTNRIGRRLPFRRESIDVLPS